MSETIEIESIRRLDVKPGETLCIKLPGRESASELARLRALVQENLPDGVKLLLLMPDVDVFVVNAAMAEAVVSGLREPA